MVGMKGRDKRLRDYGEKTVSGITIICDTLINDTE